jgi:hypothetical protein
MGVSTTWALGAGAGATSFSEIGGTTMGAGAGTSIGGASSATVPGAGMGPGSGSPGGCAGCAETRPAAAAAVIAAAQAVRFSRRGGTTRMRDYSGVQAS